ncbi:Hypothetical_protein [Hexamita inflata]|uniref:Hypothetical_protein n=1 Tax=Hexamita inflata TaxID=28002 RepID=A0AA86R2K0_9EUKA|nr:Hypothetical protein HINF_LOCUS58206 [Hexamita inflata]
MTQYNQNAMNEEYDAKMTRKYQGQIKDGSLKIGDFIVGGDSEVTNLRFLENFNIKTLNLNIDSKTNIKFRNRVIKELTLCLVHRGRRDELLSLSVDDLELENLEVLLVLNSPNLQNDQLYNLAKFKKLCALDVSNKSDIIITELQYLKNLTHLNLDQ